MELQLRFKMSKIISRIWADLTRDRRITNRPSLWTSTHFSRKVCAVEFGVIFSSLHRFVWKFPLLANRVRAMSSMCSHVIRVTWDGVTSSLNTVQTMLVPWMEVLSLLDWWSLVTWETVEEKCWHACIRLMVTAYACWMCEPTLSVCRERCWGLHWCTPISDHVRSEGSLLFYNDRNKKKYLLFFFCICF